MSTWAIVVAGGSGERFGQRKQYLPLGGERVLDWSLRSAAERADGVVLVVPADAVDDPEPLATVVVAGGATRSASVRAGLAAVPADAETIVVHDAARPGADARGLGAGAGGGGGRRRRRGPGRPRVRHAPRGRRRARSTARGSSPCRRRRRSAPRRCAPRTPDAPEGTDDASLVEAAGGRVVVVDGDPANIKITTPIDLSLAELLCR